MNDHLETLMVAAKLPEAACQRLRLAFPGTVIGGMRQAINVERRLMQACKRIQKTVPQRYGSNPMKPVKVSLVACGEGFKAIIWVREDEYFNDGVLLENKLRNRLSCNMGVFFPIEQNLSELR